MPRTPTQRPQLLRPVHPNAGVTAAYRAALERMICEMHDSMDYWLGAAYRRNEPEMAMDAREEDELLRRLDAAVVQIEGTTARAGRVTLPDGTQIIKSVNMAHGNTRGSSRGAHLRTSFHVLRAGEQYSKRITRAQLAVLLDRAAGRTTPAERLSEVVRELAERWQRNFDEAAPKLAEHFASAVADRSDTALRSILRKGGISVRFQPSEAQRDIMAATVQQNVSLIKSIPQQYLSDVEGLVMRSVQTGRDLGQLREDLMSRYGVTSRRAELIARDQNNKATSALQRARQSELGITEAVWIHSGGGREPRPTHVANNNKRYNVAQGWLDPAEGRRIWPGELINCRCVSRAVMPTATGGLHA